MCILANDEIGSVHNGTIHELVVIRVLLNEMESEIRVFAYDIDSTGYDLQKQTGNTRRGFLREYFLILVEYIVGNTQDEFFLQEGLPQKMIDTVSPQYLYQAVGVYHYNGVVMSG